MLEVDLDAMTHNLNFFRSKLSFGTKLVAMVKAGSYGAGDYEVAQLLQHQGVNYLAVAFADEASHCGRSGKRPSRLRRPAASHVGCVHNVHIGAVSYTHLDVYKRQGSG